VEVVGHIFSFIPTKDLYPHCFCINSFFLSAVLLDVEWKHRCNRELDVEDPLPNLSWKETYRGIISSKVSHIHSISLREHDVGVGSRSSHLALQTAASRETTPMPG